MNRTDRSDRWRVDGKFLRSGESRVWMKAVTYGPFPGAWPHSFDADFSNMAAAGFNCLRLYEMPEQRLLDAAARHGLRVFGGLRWGQTADFFSRPGLLSSARVSLREALRTTSDHPALAGVFVGNEIPADMVRWMGPVRVRHAIESLISLGRQSAPDLLFAYANYPSTEYLEPDNADFSAFNIYLENPAAFRSYLKRLHHIAGDRPLVISEYGMDSLRNGLLRQAETLRWALEIAHEEESSGIALYSWSDRWWNAGAEVTDWDFGLTDRSGKAKPALEAVSAQMNGPQASHNFSVIVCTRNGRSRIADCLHAVTALKGSLLETIVVDDGSTDGTADLVRQEFPHVKLIRLAPCGLSAARNVGAAAAIGEILAFTDDDCLPDEEWLLRLDRFFDCERFAAAGGPNLAPEPNDQTEAVICAAPGTPSHVLLDDVQAEHLPGCNLAVTKVAFDALGGFDEQFHTAGDDVDFCWRLSAAGYRLGFAPGAFVWHRRRPSLRAYLRQQIGYGSAERLLMEKYPKRFSTSGGAIWQGFVYGGGTIRVDQGSIIYHGPMGSAGYQSLVNRMLPLRPIDERYDHLMTRLMLRLITISGAWLRGFARCRGMMLPAPAKKISVGTDGSQETTEYMVDNLTRDKVLAQLMADDWRVCGATETWDLEKNGARLLVATEYGDHGRSRTLVRLLGDSRELPDWLRHGGSARSEAGLDPANKLSRVMIK